jgi:hypothetical protein
MIDLVQKWNNFEVGKYLTHPKILYTFVEMKLLHKHKNQTNNKIIIPNCGSFEGILYTTP